MCIMPSAVSPASLDLIKVISGPLLTGEGDAHQLLALAAPLSVNTSTGTIGADGYDYHPIYTPSIPSWSYQQTCQAFYINLVIRAVFSPAYFLLFPRYPTQPGKSMTEKPHMMDSITTAVFLAGSMCFTMAINFGGTTYQSLVPAHDIPNAVGRNDYLSGLPLVFLYLATFSANNS